MSGKIIVNSSTKKEIYLGTSDDGLKKLVNDKLEDVDSTDVDFGFMTQVSDGTIYVGTNKDGLKKLVDDKYVDIDSIRVGNGFMTQVSDGTIYVGTSTDGLKKLVNDKYVNIDSIFVDVNNGFMTQTSDGTIYVGTYNKGLTKLVNDKYVDVDSGNFYSGFMTQVSDGTIYVGTYLKGLKKLVNGSLVDVDSTNVGNGFMTQVSDGTIYVGTSTDGLKKLVNDKLVDVDSTDVGNGFMTQTSDGTIYVGTYLKGLKKLVDDKYVDIDSIFVGLGFISEVDVPTDTKTISKPFIPFATGPHAGKKVMSIDVPEFNSFQELTTMLTGFGYPTTGWAPTIHGEKVLIEGVEQTLTGVYMDANFIIVRTDKHNSDLGTGEYVSAPITSGIGYPIPHDNKIYRQTRFDNASGQVEIAGMGGKVLSLGYIYKANKNGLIEDSRIRIWNTFNENKDNNNDAEYFFTANNGYGFQSVSRHANTTTQYRYQWDAPLVIRNYRNYSKIEIKFTMMSKLNASGSNTANEAGSKAMYDLIINNKVPEMTDVPWLTGGTTHTRTDHVTLTIDNPSAAHPTVTFGNANHTANIGRMNHTEPINVAWTNNHERTQLFFGTGGDRSVSTSINHICNPNEADFAHFYGTYVTANDFCIAVAPYINDVSSAVQGMSTVVQDMVVTLT